jgi:hypothetical protein
MKTEETKYRVIVSTNTFVTNFDKEMCAFITGQIGECKIGIDRKFRAPAEVRDLFEKAMERRICADDYWRPVGPNEEDSNAFELFFKEKPSEAMIEAIIEGFNDFADEKKEKNPITTRISLEGIKIITEKTVYEETTEVIEVGNKINSAT